MNIKDFVAIVLDASQETVSGLKSVSAKLEFLLKVISMVFAAQSVQLETEDGLRDLDAKRIAVAIGDKLKAKQA